MQILSANERTHKNVKLNKKLQVSLMEPTIEYIMKCIFTGLSQVCDEVSLQKYTCFGCIIYDHISIYLVIQKCIIEISLISMFALLF